MKTPTAWQAVISPPAWQHAAAGVLHGWAEHAHHTGAELELTEEDYRAALKAAATAPEIPHDPALSEYRGMRC